MRTIHYLLWFSTCLCIYSLWPSDALWRYRSGFMRRWSHCLNQYWLIIISGQFYRKLFKISILDICLKILNLKLLPYLAGGIQSRSDNQYVCTQFDHSPTWTYKISYERFMHTGTINYKTIICKSNIWLTNHASVRFSWTHAHCDCLMKRSVFSSSKKRFVVWSRFYISQYSVVYIMVLYWVVS